MDWYKVVYPPRSEPILVPTALLMKTIAVYRSLEDKTDFCVFATDYPTLTLYFSPRAAEECTYTLGLLNNSKDVQVGYCPAPGPDLSLRLEIG